MKTLRQELTDFKTWIDKKQINGETSEEIIDDYLVHINNTTRPDIFIVRSDKVNTKTYPLDEFVKLLEINIPHVIGHNVDIHKKTRERKIVMIRQICHYLSRQYTNASLSHIGKRIGNKDHATILHSCKVVTDLMEQRNAEFIKLFEPICKILEDENIQHS